MMVFAADFPALTLPHMAHGAAVAKDNLYVRAGPAPDALVLGKLLAGQSVTVWAVDGGWAIVQRDEDGLTGWASVSYLALGPLEP